MMLFPASRLGTPSSDGNLLNMCTAYTSVTDLVLDLGFFSSLSQLRRFLRHFDRLSRLTAHHSFAGDLQLLPDGTAPRETVPALDCSLRDFGMEHITAKAASQLLAFIAAPRACSELRDLSIKLTSGHSAELLLGATEVLRRCGNRLSKFEWECHVENDANVIPQLMNNKSLGKLLVTLHLGEATAQRIESILSNILADVTSPYLWWIRIEIRLTPPSSSQDAQDKLLVSKDTPDSMSAFHALVSRPIFDHFAEDSVHIAFSTKTESAGASAMMSAVECHAKALFAPWLDRGVLRRISIPAVTTLHSSIISLNQGCSETCRYQGE
ncbi:uncharacterized protein C8Q71DRAFT_486439 [Rhodofomes roseus]|uniref:Uncharacterized protein n=1 Tax=Rhodofomes roseus TaxID=34475 RepID=A0ABQ8KPG8_9APHY|nr:uncharacterized protein C8Q71DRAFT_486439 [Rhodofomes roseus]KAH9840327.1 hypothetical protein C8Q71DRAFT_486439 [Rhodofomes roseus]